MLQHVSLCAVAAAAALGSISAPDLPSDVFPVDRNCEHMRTRFAVSPPETEAEPAYFDREIPRFIHQIWYGDPHEAYGKRMRAWEAFAARFGYAYKLWGEEDDDLVTSIMPPRTRQVFAFYRERRDWRAASDVLRLSLLHVIGGIYLDSDLQPPRDGEGPFDLSDWVPLRNVVALLETEARQTDSAALFASNVLLMAPAGHPLVAHLVATLPDNHHVWNRRLRPTAEYTTGPFLLTRSLGGPVTLLQVREAVRYALGGGGAPWDDAWTRPSELPGARP